MKNKRERDLGMMNFYVDPTSYNADPSKPAGF